RGPRRHRPSRRRVRNLLVGVCVVVVGDRDDLLAADIAHVHRRLGLRAQPSWIALVGAGNRNVGRKLFPATTSTTPTQYGREHNHRAASQPLREKTLPASDTSDAGSLSRSNDRGLRAQRSRSSRRYRAPFFPSEEENSTARRWQKRRHGQSVASAENENPASGVSPRWA